MNEEQFTMFWNGPFSQWYRSEFIVDDIRFYTAEQFMMYHKALLFNDEDMANAILRTQNPKEQKAYGRRVRGYDDETWDRASWDVVYEGSYEKFNQNPDLYQQLIDTKGTTLVEASPYDTRWGIGLGANDPRARDRAQWCGENRLGEILTQLRDNMLTKA